jgi:hypothetical protein
MQWGHLHYLPLSPTFFAILAGLFLMVLVLIQLGVLRYAYYASRCELRGHHASALRLGQRRPLALAREQRGPCCSSVKTAEANRGPAQKSAAGGTNRGSTYPVGR